MPQYWPRTSLCLQLIRGTGSTPSSKPHKICLGTPGQQQHTRLDYKAACPLLTQAPSKSHTLLSIPATTGKTQGWATQPQEATCPSQQGFSHFYLFALISVCWIHNPAGHAWNVVITVTSVNSPISLVTSVPYLLAYHDFQPCWTTPGHQETAEEGAFAVKGWHALDRPFYYMTSEWSCNPLIQRPNKYWLLILVTSQLSSEVRSSNQISSKIRPPFCESDKLILQEGRGLHV